MSLLSKIISLGIMLSSTSPQLKSLHFNKELPINAKEPSEEVLLKEYEICQQSISLNATRYWTIVSIFIPVNTALLGWVVYIDQGVAPREDEEAVQLPPAGLGERGAPPHAVLDMGAFRFRDELPLVALAVSVDPVDIPVGPVEDDRAPRRERGVYPAREVAGVVRLDRAAVERAREVLELSRQQACARAGHVHSGATRCHAGLPKFLIG